MHITYNLQTPNIATIKQNNCYLMRKCDEEESIFITKEPITNIFLVYELFTDLKCIIGIKLPFPNQ